jgi:hypothetical protein
MGGGCHAHSTRGEEVGSEGRGGRETLYFFCSKNDMKKVRKVSLEN